MPELEMRKAIEEFLDETDRLHKEGLDRETIIEVYGNKFHNLRVAVGRCITCGGTTKSEVSPGEFDCPHCNPGEELTDITDYQGGRYNR